MLKVFCLDGRGMALVADLAVETAVSKLIEELTDFGCQTMQHKKYWYELQGFLQTTGPLINSLIDVLRNSGQGTERFRPFFEALHESLQEAKAFKQRGEPRLVHWPQRWKMSKNMQQIQAHIKELVPLAHVVGVAVDGEVLSQVAASLEKAIQQERSDLAADVLDGTSQGKLCDPMPIPANEFVVGQENDVLAVKKLLLHPGMAGDTENWMIGIVGMGGSGKTTLAKTVCKEPDVMVHFDCISMVIISLAPDIWRSQQQIWKDLVGEPFPRFADSKEGKMQLLEKLEGKKVLLVTDDVWNASHIDCLKVINPLNGSRILVTTRSKKVVAGQAKVHIHELSELTHRAAIRLFCHHAFHTREPPSYLEDDVESVVQECSMLPLALEVIGSLMASEASGVEEEVWHATLDGCAKKLRYRQTLLVQDGQTAEDKLLASLRLSFESLNEMEKQCFLLFASFAEDYRLLVSDVIDMWIAANKVDRNEAIIMWQYLVSISLIKWDRVGAPGFQSSDVQLEMGATGFQDVMSDSCYVHDLVRDMALKIAADGSIAERTQLFFPGPEPSFAEIVRLLPPEVMAKELSFASQCVGDWDWGVRMPNMRVLLLRDTTVWAVSPNILLMTQLCILDLAYSKIVTLPEGISDLRTLRLLQLDGCKELERLPSNMGALSHLSVLSLRFCTRLEFLPESVGSLQGLFAFHAPGCKFVALPATIGLLEKLHHLDISYCEDLNELPPELCHLTCLEALNLAGLLTLHLLPKNLGNLKSLKKLIIAGCVRLTNLPDSLSLLTKLEVLDMQACHAIQRLPNEIGALQRLRKLYMNKCWESRVCELPSSMSRLKSLEILGLDVLSTGFGVISEHFLGPGIDCWFGGYLPSLLKERIEMGDVKIEQDLHKQSILTFKKVCQLLLLPHSSKCIMRFWKTHTNMFLISIPIIGHVHQSSPIKMIVFNISELWMQMGACFGM